VVASFGSEESPLRTYFSTRNKLLWAETHATTRDWLRIVRSTLGGRWPRLRIDRGNGTPLHKAVLWACGGFARDIVRRLHNPQEVAHRRAIFDYGLRRFGDCPPRIRALARAWSERRDALRAAGAREP
jgi:hypothetical protein